MWMRRASWRCRWGPVQGLVAVQRAADTGQDGADDLVAWGERGGAGTGGMRQHLAASGRAGFVDQALAAQLAEVLGGPADGVGAVPGHGVDLAESSAP